MSDVHHVIATVRQPDGRGDPGQVTTGYYTIADGVVLTMTDSNGTPVRDHKTGERFTHKLVEGDNAYRIAGRLTLKIYKMRHGDDAGFNRPLSHRGAA